jgi:carboxymethylenebutenolidase
MKTITALLVILLIVGLGIVVYRAADGGERRNVDALSREDGLDIATSSVEYFEGTQGYLAEPREGGDRPGVVMIHENRGLRPEIKMTADQLAGQGYRVLAVDLFNGRVVESQDEARALTTSFDQAKGIENMRAAVDYLRSTGSAKVASLGWCFGGKQSVELAISGEPLDATIVYYGGGLTTSTERLARIDWPVLGIFGDQDQVIPTSTVAAFENSLDLLGVDYEIHMYEGVGHAFANPSGMNYAPEETEDAWEETLAFLDKYLKPDL